METIGSEVGLKMRSAIKAKLMELGCYVDDELPDYVMVMVANKRTRLQMEEDLQLFLSGNTEAFVGWLHQVLQKLQEVTINTKLVNNLEQKKAKSKHSDSLAITKKEHKEKDKKKDKDKSKTRQKLKSKSKKSKKEKSRKNSNSNDEKEPERIRPNVPRLLMNLEKESSPSITDVFAGQILKTHGITSTQSISNNCEKIELIDEDKPKNKLLRNRFPIIDPATVSQIDTSASLNTTLPKNQVDSFDIPSITEIEKIDNKNDSNSNNNLKKKPNESAASGSEDEDFINIRTEAEELMDMGINDDVPANATNKAEAHTPPLQTTGRKPHSPINVAKSHSKEPIKAPEQQLPDFPQIELNLPKRPLRERLGVKNDNPSNKRAINMVNPYQLPKSKISWETEESFSNRYSGKAHFEKSNSSVNLRDKISVKQRLSLRDNFPNKNSDFKKKIGSRVVPLPNEPSKNITVAVASVVRAPPRPPPQGISAAPQLLLRAMADAHKSLLSMPPKVESNFQLKKKALVLPMRRNINPQKIIIEVPTVDIPMSKCHENQDSDFEIDIDSESLGELENDSDMRPSPVDNPCEYVPKPLGNKIDKPKPIDYIPTHIGSTKRKKGIGLDDGPAMSKILNSSNNSPKINLGKDPQFVVTLDGLDPNVFLEKKLQMICDDDSETEDNCDFSPTGRKSPENDLESNKIDNNSSNIKSVEKTTVKKNIVITFNETTDTKKVTSTIIDDANNSTDVKTLDKSVSAEKSISNADLTSPDVDKSDRKSQEKKRKASPIIFNEGDTKMSKTIIKTNGSKEDKSKLTNKYDSLPSLPLDRQRTSSVGSVHKETRCRFWPDCRLGTACEFYHPPLPSPGLKQASICRAFPACTFGNKCVYVHPPCKFNTTCVRRDCPYSHSEKSKTPVQTALTVSPVVASRVVPATNYKTISTASLPSICKFYPNCINPGCHWYHPKPCRFGKYCTNKIECNFYHQDAPLKWKGSQLI